MAIVVAEKLGKGVGVDAEHIRGRFPPDVFATIGTAREKDLISRHPEPTRDRLRYAIFSAKESVFKCLYGAFKERWPLEAIDIHVDAGLNSFTTSPVEPRAGLAIRGRIGFSEDHVVTVAWLPGWTGTIDTRESTVRVQVFRFRRQRDRFHEPIGDRITEPEATAVVDDSFDFSASWFDPLTDSRRIPAVERWFQPMAKRQNFTEYLYGQSVEHERAKLRFNTVRRSVHVVVDQRPRAAKDETSKKLLEAKAYSCCKKEWDAS